jgi:hypothetical protein
MTRESDEQRKEVEADMKARFSQSWTKDPGSAPPEVMRKAAPERLFPAWHNRTAWHFVCMAGTDPASILEPSYFLPLHGQLKSFDVIDVDWEDFSCFGQFKVIRSDVTGVYCQRIYLAVAERPVRPSPRGEGIRNDVGAVYEYRGPVRKWCVELNGATLRDGFENEAMAAQWLGNWLKVRAAGS